MPKLSWLSPLLLLLPVAIPAEAQLTSDPAAEKCTLEGQVVKAGTGEPLKKARVLLYGRDGSRNSASTNAAGRFVLKEVEPGRYRLWVERNGYASREYGQRAPHVCASCGTILTLAPGQHLRDIVVRLLPAAVISGHVYDEDGEPISRVAVKALQHRYMRGQRKLISQSHTTTNDRGEYHLYGLAPGRYYVGAIYTWFSTPGSLPGGRRESIGHQVYDRTYYPGTSQPSEAAPLILGPGEELDGADFAILLTRAVNIRGRVFSNVTGRSGPDVSVWLEERAEGGLDLGTAPRSGGVDNDGNFEILAVPPGSYILSPNWTDPESRQHYSDRVPIEVGTTDLEGIVLEIYPEVDLEGHIVVEGQDVPASLPSDSQPGEPGVKGDSGGLDFSTLYVSLELGGDLPPKWFRDRPEEDGSFVLRSIARGSYTVWVRPLPGDFYLKEAHFGGEDVLEQGLTMTGGPPAGLLELVLSPNGGHIQGVVLDDERKPLDRAQVVLVPEPPRRHQFRLYETDATDRYGRFLLWGLHPGQYKLFAWEYVDRGACQDPDFLRPYEEHGEEVRMREGETLNVELNAISSDPFQR